MGTCFCNSILTFPGKITFLTTVHYHCEKSNLTRKDDAILEVIYCWINFPKKMTKLKIHGNRPLFFIYRVFHVVWIMDNRISRDTVQAYEVLLSHALI